MKIQSFFRLGLALFLVIASIWVAGLSTRPATAAHTAAGTSPIIADHTVVDQYDDIPQEYIDRVKKMWLNVPGESHSRGYRNGIRILQSLDSRFQVNVTESNAPEPYTDQHLRVSQITRSASGWNVWGYGEADWYTNASAITKTKNHLDYSNTHNLEIAAIGFGWCWDMTWHNVPGGTIDPVYQVRWAGSSEGGPDGDMRWGLDAEDYALTGNHVSLATYLSATQQYVDYARAQGYTTTVFFTTGPVDGYEGESGYQRYLKHEGIRNYVRASSDLVLFDYADILSWNDAGAHYTRTFTDYGGTPRAYEMIHPDNMRDFDPAYGDPSGGDHIGEYGALRLAKALWWMLARLSGWDGTPAGSDTPTPSATITATSTVGPSPTPGEERKIYLPLVIK